MKFEADGIPVDKLPKPTGWRILIAPIIIEEVSKGGIALPAIVTEAREYFRTVAKVVAMGPECYTHPKFTGGRGLDEHQHAPWCKVGDIIQYHSFTGIEVSVTWGGETAKLRYINDENVISVFDDQTILINS